MFFIVHRRSTVRHAHRIIVVDDGRVVEEGTHEELLAADDLNATLWQVRVGDVEGLSPAFVERARLGGGFRTRGRSVRANS